MSECTCGAYEDGDLTVPHSVGCPKERAYYVRYGNDRSATRVPFEEYLRSVEDLRLKEAKAS